MARKTRKISLVVGGLLIVLAALLVTARAKFGPFYRSDLRVHVENVGDMEFEAVTVQVAGAQYELGVIGPGKGATALIALTGDSSVRLTVKNLRGDVQHFDVDNYIGAGTVGDIRIEVTDSRLVQVDTDLFLNNFNFKKAP